MKPFKLVSYYYNRHRPHANLGDAIQTVAMIRFLQTQKIPWQGFVNRAQLEPHMLINGFQNYTYEPLPYQALFVGVHASNKQWQNIDKRLTVGCRDIWSKKQAELCNLQAVITGCVTSSLAPITAQRRYIVYADSISKYTNSDMVKSIGQSARNASWEHLMKWAIQRINFLAQAQLVYTTRLHVALPCIAMKIPVILEKPKRPTRLHPGIYKPERFTTLLNYIQYGKVVEPQSGVREQLLDLWLTGFKQVWEHNAEYLQTIQKESLCAK